MRGHENIIAMRKGGNKPAGAVWVCDYPVQPSLLQWRYADDCKNPNVCTAGDHAADLDMRFVVGLPVFVHGDDAARVRAIAAQCRKVGADRVVASTPDKLAIWNKGDAKWQTF